MIFVVCLEPSGRMHLAQGLMKKLIVDRMTKAGFTFILFVADWFALLNLKMGGKMEDIQTTGRYLIEIWQALGMDMSRVRYVLSDNTRFPQTCCS